MMSIWKRHQYYRWNQVLMPHSFLREIQTSQEVWFFFSTFSAKNENTCLQFQGESLLFFFNIQNTSTLECFWSWMPTLDVNQTQLCWQEELGLDDRWSWRQCAQEPLTSSRPLPLHVHFLLILISLLASLSPMPNLSPQHAHSLVYRPPTPPPPPLVHDASPSILLMSPLRPNWWVNSNKLPSLHLSIVSWSLRASLPLSLVPHPPPPPAPFTALFIIH